MEKLRLKDEEFCGKHDCIFFQLLNNVEIIGSFVYNKNNNEFSPCNLEFFLEL